MDWVDKVLDSAQELTAGNSVPRFGGSSDDMYNTSGDAIGGFIGGGIDAIANGGNINPMPSTNPVDYIKDWALGIVKDQINKACREGVRPKQ
jgi:hypothetical protein